MRFASLLIVVILAAEARAAAPEHRAERPNILLITADDLGEQLSCYGEKRIATPQIDALAAAGVRFANAYCPQSSCSSSRSSLLTGLWPHQNGQVGLANGSFTMRSGIPNLPALLKKAGYRTGIIGKLHVSPGNEFPFDWMPAKERMDPGPTRNVQWVRDESHQFLAEAKKSGQPFFFYVNYLDPHDPLDEKTDRVNGVPEHILTAQDVHEALPFPRRTQQEKLAYTAHYLNTVLRLDAGLGMLLDELRASGFADNTVVIYLGDNGIAVVRGKQSSYEWGGRVPLIIRWPGVAKAGQVRKEMVSFIDIMPTLLEAAAVHPPADLPGLSLSPLLRGQSPNWREFLFTEMNFHMPGNFFPQRTVRDDRWKLLLNLSPGANQQPLELFDLQTDPRETKNLADDPKMAATRQRLEAALHEWRQQTNDPLLDPARLQRWKQAAHDWAKLPPGPNVRLAKGELDRLK